MDYVLCDVSGLVPHTPQVLCLDLDLPLLQRVAGYCDIITTFTPFLPHVTTRALKYCQRISYLRFVPVWVIPDGLYSVAVQRCSRITCYGTRGRFLRPLVPAGNTHLLLDNCTCGSALITGTKHYATPRRRKGSHAAFLPLDHCY